MSRNMQAKRGWREEEARGMGKRGREKNWGQSGGAVRRWRQSQLLCLGVHLPAGGGAQMAERLFHGGCRDRFSLPPPKGGQKPCALRLGRSTQATRARPEEASGVTYLRKGRCRRL